MIRKLSQKNSLTRWTFITLLLWAVTPSIAQKVDFNYNTENESGRTATGFTAWVMNDVNLNGESQITFDNGVTIKISHGPNSSATKITRGWNKNLVAGNDELRLIQDGIIAKSGNDQLTTGKAAIIVTLSGLSVGNHTLDAYHNFCDRGITNCPPICVSIGGEEVVSNIPQTYCETTITKAACAKTSVAFVTTDANEVVEICYYTNPQSETTYACTSFYINGFELGEVSADTRATSPSPENGDLHAVANGTSVILSWQGAAAGASKHTVYVADSEAGLNTATGVTTTNTSITKNGLSPLKRYYWRVDETINGQTYKGDVWSFQPRRDAFPGAEGYGRYAIGGRGQGNGIVYHVTSLDDDIDNPAVGTLRYGITRLSGPRTIVFDVAGVITLKGRLTCSDKFVTIAGQTAPGRGILLKAAPFGMASDGITRFIRTRLGHLGISSVDTGLDGMGMAGNDYSIMDHCSISWTIDEGFSSRNARNITLQRTLISEALNVAGHPNYSAGTGHGYAATIGGGQGEGTVGSFHHNLLAHNEGRNWSMSGGLDGKGNYDGHHDMFNNVCYNWGNRATDGGTHEGQFVNNYYKMGKATTQKILLRADLEGTGGGSQAYYVNGNIRENVDGSITNDQQNVTYDYRLYPGQTLDWTVFQSSRFFDSQATIETAQAAYHNVLSDVGCNQPEIDNHDSRMVNETVGGTYSTTGSYDGKSDGLIDSEEDSGCEGFSGLNIISATRESDWDTDQDGIPNWFEEARGWDVAVANNNDCDDEINYYTNLEEYLNWMAVPHFYNLNTGEATTIELADYFAGYTNPTFTINGEGINKSLTGTQLTFIPTKGGLGSFTVKATQGNVTLTRTFNIHALGEDIVEEEEVYEEIVLTDAFVEGTPAILSYSTYVSSTGSSDNKDLIWNFNNDFTVGSTNGDRSYANQNDYIKYSRNYTYIVNIPSDQRVTAMEVKGYANSSDNTAYLSNVNGVAYEADVYSFPTKNSSATYLIEFDKPVTGQLTFKPANTQVCWIITLYTEKSGQTESLVLKEAATVFATSEGTIEAKTYSKVKLERTLSNQYYSTLCVPFDISAEDIANVLGDAEVYEFSSVNGTMMKFGAAANIQAGIPYILKPKTTVSNPEFENVQIFDIDPITTNFSDYAFAGHYVRYSMPYNSNELFLGTDGKLKKPKAEPNNKTLGLRATFAVPANQTANVQVIIDGGTTALLTVEADSIVKQEGIYNLNGQALRIDKGILPKGVYIVNGKKMVIK